MTDEEWEKGCGGKDWELHATLWWVMRNLRASMRKLRLFACACCRRGWDLLPAEAWHAVEIAELFADYRATNRERGAAYKAVARLVRTQRVVAAARHAVAPMRDGHSACKDISQTSATIIQALATVRRDTAPTPEEGRSAYMSATTQERAAQFRMLACLFLNPESVFPYQLDTKTPVVQIIAEAAYEERALPLGLLDNARLAVLSDALEEIGAAPQILAHLRRPEAHYRGCWALDLALGREVPWSLRARESAVDLYDAEIE